MSPAPTRPGTEIDPASLTDRVGHRPWPLPDGPWVLFQSWRDLLFAHWPVPAEHLRSLVPSGLEVDTFDGSGWVGLTPFRLMGLRARWLPPVPGLSSFPEMNLRTYVRVGERPGIHFFSLDAASRLAVAGARALYRLPYHRARMTMERRGDWIRYRSRRVSNPDAEFAGRYRPVGRVGRAGPGTLEAFLTERYALYTVLGDGTVLRGQIHHPPWPLQEAEADIRRNGVPQAHGIRLPDRPPLLHFSARQDTLVWPPETIPTGTGSTA